MRTISGLNVPKQNLKHNSFHQAKYSNSWVENNLSQELSFFLTWTEELDQWLATPLSFENPHSISFSFPNKYPKNQNCKWTINVCYQIICIHDSTSLSSHSTKLFFDKVTCKQLFMILYFIILGNQRKAEADIWQISNRVV